ncbi:MAG TPA: single-stranded-DNA-specific exonuclease RecJ, partial [Steroidobacteraceae bacterium]|nr:single-stranded-DNA-specific exonuclease RecJ [Steroidobacteraceae bacterium]
RPAGGPLMSTPARRIVRRDPRAELQAALPASLHPVLRRVYGARGVTHADDLALRLDQLLPVRSLEGVEQAAERLVAAHRQRARVLVIGDFDADGATSTALVVRHLRLLGFEQPDFLVPDRFRFGYGLTPEIVRVAADRRPDLIVTVDNGISSVDGVEEARRCGIDVLVTDHHLPGRELPRACCIVNPNAPGATFGSKALAGVGVAFYVMAALTHAMHAAGRVPAGVDASPAQWLDLVALGTVADVVPLDLNNRVLVAQGLRRIRRGRCVPGLRALLELAGRELAGVTGQDLGFQAGPRLNAAGRLDDMSRGIRCLLTDDPVEARGLAAELAQLNTDRRELEARMQFEAVAHVDARVATLEGRVPAGVCVFDEGWHQGVIGLVASRVKERLHRPVIAFAPSEPGWIKGSARSVPGVHVRDVLDAVATGNPGMLDKFGGHAMAAGLALRTEHLPAFESAFAAEVERRVDDDTLAGQLHTDGELLAGEFCVETAAALREGGPWGSGFPEPVFDGRFEVFDARVVADRHLKLRLRCASGEAVEAIAFRHYDDARAPAIRPQDRVELVYRAGVDEYAGQARLQLLVEYVAPLASDRKC